jgi:hypothetical protein
MTPKRRIILAIVFILFFINFQVQKNKFVSSEFKIGRQKQDRVTVSIFLNPTNGIHVNSEPKPDIKFNNENVEIIEVKFEKTQKNYIDTGKPIKVEIKLKSKAISTLTGQFTYFYCSEIEGWCSKATEKFEIKLK